MTMRATLRGSGNTRPRRDDTSEIERPAVGLVLSEGSDEAIFGDHPLIEWGHR